MFLYAFYRRYIWLLRVIALFFMGLIVAIIVALSQMNLEALRGNILTGLRDATGMQIEIDGDMSWKFSLRPEIEFNNVRIPNADWAKNKNLFVADKIDVRLDLFSLFRKKPAIRHIRIIDAKINLEKKASGENSIVINESADDENESKKDSENAKIEIAKYPFKPLPFEGLDIENVTANIYGDKYRLASFGIHNHLHDDTLEFTGWVKPYEINLPFVVRFDEYNAERKVYPMRIAFATGANALIADVALEGTSRIPFDFVIRGDIPNLKKSGDWFNLNLFQMPLMNVDIAVGINNKKITFRKSTVKFGKSDISFSGTYDWSKSVPVVRAKITSNKIDVYKTFPEWFGAGVEWIHPPRELNVFHDMPLFGDVMYNIDADVDVNIKHFVVYRSLDLANSNLKLKAKNHKLYADANLIIGNGNINAVIDADIEPDGTYVMTGAGRGEHIYVGEILRQIYIKNVISGLPLDLDLYVRATGKDMSEIMQTMTGPVVVYSVDSGFAHADLVEYMYGGDFLTNLRHNVEDLFTGNKRDMIQIDGAVANVKLRDGLIETKNGVAVETHVINLRLAGSLDLGKETIDLSLASVPVRGLKLSLSGNLVNALQISGNLAEPDFKINGAAVVGKVGAAFGLGLLLAPLTGGLSVAGGLVAGWLAGDLLEGWLADEHPYRTALESGAPIKRDDPEWFRVPVTDLATPLLEFVKQNF